VAANYAPTIGSINQNQLTWRQSVPASDKKKPLSNLDGYQAMISKLQTLLEKGKDTTIILSSPPLARVAKNVCFSHAPLRPMFVDALCQPDDVAAGLGGVGREVEEFQEGPIGSAIREQKVRFSTASVCIPLCSLQIQESLNRANAPTIEQLRERYPIGNDPQFPDKRVYSDGHRSWELNDIRLQVWAAAIVSICINLVTNI
jgi:hypothetical protein